MVDHVSKKRALQVVSVPDAALSAEIMGAIDDLEHNLFWDKKSLCSRMMQARIRLRRLIE